MGSGSQPFDGAGKPRPHTGTGWQGVTAQSAEWAVSEIAEAQTDSKH
jgi:hypothetical protein